MAGKYQELAKQFPRALPRDGAFQENVDALKKLVKPGARTPNKLATRYAELRAEKDKHDAVGTELNTKLAAIEQLMWTAFERGEMESLKLKTGQTISVTEDVAVSIDNRDKFLAWIKKNNLESLLTVYAKTVESMTKERLLAGSPAPDGVKLGSFKKTSFTKK